MATTKESLTVRTTCKVGACEPYCGIEMTVDDGRITSVKPDKAHPISEGYFCRKGHHVLDYQYDPDRLLSPTRPASGGGWESVTWETATTDIGTRLRAIVDAHGPRSIATYWGNAADSVNITLARTFANAFGSPNSFNVLSLEFTDRAAVASRLFGVEGLMLQPDADNTSFALLLGTNPVVTQGMALLQRRPHIRADLRDIQRRGGTLVVVDPRRTETAELADRHLAIRPGTDLYLLVAMIKRILETGADDSEFLDAHTSGIKVWRSLAANFTIDDAAHITGIDAGR